GFFGSKPGGVASIATVCDGTALPPSTTYDFSTSLNGTFAVTVAPGVKGTPPKLKPAENARVARTSHAASENRIEGEVNDAICFKIVGASASVLCYQIPRRNRFLA